jgi:hypothetical protein
MDSLEAVEVEFSDDIPHEGILVFCPDGLLQEVLNHLVANARAHRAGVATPGIRFSLSVQSENIVLRAGTWNTQVRTSSLETHPERDRAGGLADLHRRLQAFDGRIDLDPSPTHERYTFLTHVTFIRG